MDARLIERLDRKRYRYILLTATGFALVLGCMLTDQFVTGYGISTLLALLSMPGSVILFAGLIAYNRNQRRIKSKADLRSALNNELIRHYGYISSRNGCLAGIASVLLIMFIEPWSAILTVRITCLIIMYISVMTFFISCLIYMRR